MCYATCQLASERCYVKLATAHFNNLFIHVVCWIQSSTQTHLQTLKSNIKGILQITAVLVNYRVIII